jgi:hypothetical protein
MLFLILLIVLVISIVFGNMMNLESFVPFGQSVNVMDTINVPQYNKTKTVYKLYDNLYFDDKNGNLIEVNSSSQVSGSSDLIGSTINNILVTPRDGQSTTTYNNQLSGNTILSVNTDKSMVNSVQSSYTSWIYPTQTNSTDSYSTIYLPWRTNTFIHIINNTNQQNVATCMFGDVNSIDRQTFNNSTITLSTPVNNNYYSEIYEADNLYSTTRKLYKISDYIKFDISNANLIINVTNNSIKAYDRYGNPTTITAPVTNLSGSVPNRTFGSWVTTDEHGSMVLYIHNAMKTLIAVIQKDGISGYKLVNVCRFTPDGFDKEVVTTLTTSSPSTDTTTATTPTTSTPTTTPSIPTSALSEYFKWYWFFKTNQNKNSEVSEDYILKTQIVPPVCPSCPACPGSVCGNCGGQGGAGTLTTTGNTVATTAATTIPSTNIPGAVASLGTTAGDVAGKTIDATGKLVGGASTLGEKAVTGTVGLAKETTTGAVGLAKETVGGAVGLAKETVGGAVGLAREAGSGLKSLLTPNPMNVRSGQPQYGTNEQVTKYGQTQYGTSEPVSKYGTQTTGADNYSYYGALPQKSSNFMPITADFSAFGK